MYGIIKPQVNINLKPIYGNDFAEVTYISVKLTFGGLSGGLQGGSPLDKNNSIDYFEDMITDNRVDDIAAKFDNIQAHDDAGPLVVSVEHGPAQSHSLVWKTDRPVQGDLTLCYNAKPHQNGALNSNVNALGRDSDGLVGIAASFIPIPAIKEPSKADVNVAWDISQAPEKTRALSSFGEGNTSQKEISLKTLSECVFMVGQIDSFTPPAPVAEGGFRGIHWLGTLPDNLSSMTEFTSNMFPRLSAFFKDDSTKYRIFLRRVPRGLRATSVTGGTLIDYDEDAKEEHDWDIVRLFNSSMISTWARLDPEDDGTSNDWFTKGISYIYTIYLPYRFGQRTPDYFRATLNGYFSSYFTNPFINYPLDKIPPDSWHGQSALAMRSCIYMIRMDAYTRRASVACNAGILRPIDEIVADISSRRLRGEKVQVKDWIKYLGDWIGEESAQEHFDRMRGGEIMDLEDMKTGFDGIQSEEQRVLEVGFNQQSLETGIVQGVIEQSEAEKGGLMNGDKVIWHSRLEKCRMQYEEKFRLLVDRDGKEVSIEYWPRSDKAVKSWLSKKKQ